MWSVLVSKLAGLVSFSKEQRAESKEQLAESKILSIISHYSFAYGIGGPSSLDSNRLKHYLPHTALHFCGYALNVSRAILGGG